MSKQAKYSLEIPRADDLGNSLDSLILNAKSFFAEDRRIPYSFVTGSHISTYRGRRDDIHHLVAIAEDSPEVDPEIKQRALYVAQAANRPHANVVKESRQGVQHWQVKNSAYQSNRPAPAANAQTSYPRNTVAMPHYQGSQALS